MRLAGVPAARPQVLVVVLFVLAVALDAVPAGLDPGQWWGSISATVHVVQCFSRLGDGVVAAVAAALASNARRCGLSLWGATSVRGRAAQVEAVVAGSVIPVWLAHTLVGAVMFVMSVQRGGWAGAGWWVPLALATGPVLSTVWAITGCALGLRLPRVIAVAVASIAPFALVAVLDVYLEGSPVAVLTYARSGTFIIARPDEASLAARLTAMAAVGCWAWATLVRAGRWMRSVAAAAVVVVGAAAFLIGPRYVDNPGAADASCSGAAPRICMLSAYEPARTMYTEMIRPAWEALPTPLRRPALDATAGEIPDAIQTGLDDGVRVNSLVPKRMAAIAALGTAAWPSPGECEWDDETAAASHAFEMWWLHRFGIPTDGSGPLNTNLVLALGADYPKVLEQAHASKG